MLDEGRRAPVSYAIEVFKQRGFKAARCRLFGDEATLSAAAVSRRSALHTVDGRKTVLLLTRWRLGEWSAIFVANGRIAGF